MRCHCLKTARCGKTIKICTLLLALAISHYPSALAQSLPNLGKQQMYADFDMLTENIMAVSPQPLIRKKVTGFDLQSALTQLRGEISHAQNTLDFAFIVRKAITLCQDGHSSLIWNGYYESEQECEQDGISKNAFHLIPLYDSLLRIAARIPFNLRLKYINGEYYTLGDFVYNNKTFPPGLKIINCNGSNIHEFVQQLLGDVRMLRWDFENKRYFGENFFKGFNFKKEDSLALTFEDHKGELIFGKFYLGDTINYGNNNYMVSSGNQADTFKTVEYFPRKKILYIRVPRMTLEHINYYLSNIQHEGRKGSLKKVIIDIRNNPGGADNVWTSILKNIIARPISYQNVLLCNNSNLIRTKLLTSAPNPNPFAVPFLDSSNYLVYYQGPVALQPDSNSLQYKGNIYLLQDENIYSSAGSFTAVAQLAPNIITVGSNTGRLLGRGLNPLVFELPNSKILYRLEPVIDFLNVKEPEDVFHDRVEIPVPLSIEDYWNRLSSKQFIYAADYLFRKDPVFRKAMAQ